MKYQLLSLALFSILLISCGPSTATIEIQPVGDTMAYATTSFTVKAGQEVSLTMNNTATSPAMHHNVVILSSMSELAVTEVGTAAVNAAANGYIPSDSNILFYTAMAAPGESKTVVFTAPTTPGKYRYICTYPGHFALMQGTMIVE